MENKPVSEKKVIIASYTHIANGVYTTIGGPALAIKNYLLANKIKRLVCIWQPLPISDTLSTIEEVFENGKEIIKRKFFLEVNRQGLFQLFFRRGAFCSE